MKLSATNVSFALLVAVVNAGRLDQINKNGKWVAEIDDTAELAIDVSLPSIELLNMGLMSRQSVRLQDGSYLNCDDRVKDANGKPVYKREKIFMLTADDKFASCCDRGQALFGSKETTFICCPAGHTIAGSNDVGFTCCLEGQTYDGQKCKTPDPVCENGKELVDGKCVCPKGQEEGADGKCKPKAKCDSGIVSGMISIPPPVTSLNSVRQVLHVHGGERTAIWLQQRRRLQILPRHPKRASLLRQVPALHR